MRARVERALEPRPAAERQRRAGQHSVSPAAGRDLEAGAAIGVEPQGEPLLSSVAPARDQGLPAARRSAGCEPDPDAQREAVRGAQGVGVRDLDVGAGANPLRAGGAHAGEFDRRPLAARQPDDLGLELGGARRHDPEPLARVEREPVGVPDDDVPVDAEAHSPSGGGAALTSSIASATCSHDQRNSSSGWLSAGCRR